MAACSITIPETLLRFEPVISENSVRFENVVNWVVVSPLWLDCSTEQNPFWRALAG